MKCLANIVEFMTMGRDCEMKISPTILINKTCHSHHRFLASKCDWGFSKLQSRGCCHPITVTVEGLGEYKKQDEQGNKIGSRQLRCILEEEIQLAQGLGSSHTESAKFLNLIPDLWCSVCLLPLLQTCMWPDSPSCILGAFFSELLKFSLPVLESQTFPPNKITVYFQIVTIFFNQ